MVRPFRCPDFGESPFVPWLRMRKNRRKQGPFWCRNPFNVLLKIALPDVDRISTVLRLCRPRQVVRDEEPKNKRREYASRIVRKTSVLITDVMNAVQCCFAFCSLVGVEIRIAGKGSNSAARRKGNAFSSWTVQRWLVERAECRT